ncbi:MAG: 7-cyano-7-deazaguanine synthase [Planctomycetota bacterium]
MAEASTRPAVICLSGGMDSTALLMHLLADGRDVYGLSFNYGQKHRVELDRLEENLAYLRKNGYEVDWHLLEMPQIGNLFFSALTNDDWDVPEGHYEQDNMKQTVVPNRNAIFSSIAYGYALSVAMRLDTEVDMCLGVHSGDHAIYPDCRPEFYDAIFAAFESGNWDSERVGRYLPYLELDKFAILEDAAAAIDKLGLDFETVFRNTCTSYSPDADGRSHGLTGSDVERILAFHQLGIPDPVEYRLPWDDVVQQALELEREFKASS